MSIEPDAIELAVVVERTRADVWPRVSEPGWFINEGALVDHDVEWDGDDVRVTDPQHGTFDFTLLSRREGETIAFSSRDTAGSERMVRFDLADVDEGTLVRVVESGFASGAGTISARVEQHATNAGTWLHQLRLLTEDLEH